MIRPTVLLLLGAAVLTAQEPAPVPSQILTAKKVFVANAGGDVGPDPYPLFSGGQDRAYNDFYAAMKTWGRYELVGAPSEADLLFEISFAVRPGRVWQGDTMSYNARFRLVVRDPRTNAMLWALAEPLEPALLQGNRDKNFDQALARVVSDIKRVVMLSAIQLPEQNRK